MNNKFVTYICYSLIFLFAAFLVGTSPLLVEISKTFKLTVSQSGRIFTFNFIGFVIFVLIGGLAADRFGKKAVLVISLIGFSISLFLFTLSGNYQTACAVMLFVGGFGGIMESTVCALVADMNTENTSFYINLSQVFFGFGAIAGPILISLAISNSVRWQVSYYIFGVSALMLAAILLFIKLPKILNTSSFDFKDVKALISSKKVFLISLCMLFYTGSEVGSWGWMVTYLNKDMNYSALKSSMAVGAFWGAMSIGRLICGQLIGKFGTRRLIIYLAASSAVVVLLAGIIRVEALLWVLIILMGLAFSSQWALIAAYGSEGYKELSGTAFSLLVAGGGIGGSLVPYLMGFISEKTSMRIAMMSPSLLFIGIAVIFIRFKRTEAIEK